MNMVNISTSDCYRIKIHYRRSENFPNPLRRLLHHLEAAATTCLAAGRGATCALAPSACLRVRKFICHKA